MVVREHERGPRAQHAVNLAEQPVEILDLVHHPGRQRDVDRIGAEEREIRGVALVPLHPDLGRVGQAASERELRRGHVDRDHVRALAGHRYRVLARPAPDVEHPSALEVAADAEVGLGRQVGTELHCVGTRRRPAPRRQPVPGLCVCHAGILPLGAARPLGGLGRATCPRRIPRSCGELRRRGTAPAATS